MAANSHMQHMFPHDLLSHGREGHGETSSCVLMEAGQFGGPREGQGRVWAFGQVLILPLLLAACETLASVLTSVSPKSLSV